MNEFGKDSPTEELIIGLYLDFRERRVSTNPPPVIEQLKSSGGVRDLQEKNTLASLRRRVRRAVTKTKILGGKSL